MQPLPSMLPALAPWHPDAASEGVAITVPGKSSVNSRRLVHRKMGRSHDGSIDPLLSVRRFAMIQVTAVWANDYLDIFRGIPNSETIWNHMEPYGTIWAKPYGTKPYGTIISTCQSCHPFDTLGALAWLDDMSWASGVTLRNLPRSQEICWKLQ